MDLMSRINDRLLEGAVKNMELCRRMERHSVPSTQYNFEECNFQQNTYNININIENFNINSLDDLRGVLRGFHI